MNSTVPDTKNNKQARPRVITTGGQLRAEIDKARQEGNTIGLVPTMGALHAGHLSLVARSRAECDMTIVSVFVNPTQFGPNEDFDRYPRDLAADVASLADFQVDLIFAPSVNEMYPSGFQTDVHVGEVAERLEGAHRPGHFQGVATIVLKLFRLAPADVAFFGQKDYQQTLVVKQLVRDYDLPIEIRVCPIVREADGLALSSRNAYLSTEERRRALAISTGLQLACDLFDQGERNAETIRERITAHLKSAGVLEIDYVALVRDGTVIEVTEVDGPTVVAIAARVGNTRLIDNRVIG